MIFSSSLLVASCFPVITSTKQFTCKFYTYNVTNLYAESILNNGLFLLFFALGSIFTFYRLPDEKFQFKAVYCFIVTILEVLCTTVISISIWYS